MGKRAQEKRLLKEQEDQSRKMRSKHPIIDWKTMKHPHFYVAVVAFLLVISYPLVTNSIFYKKHIKKISAEELAVETANEAIIKTDKGEIVFRFEKKSAPKTTENFIRLAKRGYYNNLTFHRVEEGFVIQGGDPKGDGSGGESAFGGHFVDEIDEHNPTYIKGYTEGTVAMANSGPNTNGSQFFITLADQPNLPKKYTIFGRVQKGMDVVKKITKGDKMSVEVR